MYIGIEKSIHASWIPPIALRNVQIRGNGSLQETYRKVLLGPLASSQCGKNKEKMKP
jgi:hypothetical protein